MVHPILGPGTQATASNGRSPARRPGRITSRWNLGLGVLAVALLGLAVWLALPASPAWAFCRTTTCAVLKPPQSCQHDPVTKCWATGIPLSWTTQCMSFSVNVHASPLLGLNYDDALAIADASFTRWPLATCPDGGSPSIAYSSKGGLTCSLVEYNANGPNANVVVFRDDVWTHEPTALALTTVHFNVRTGQILDADMEINTQSSQVGIADLPFVITHESGHFGGLDHSHDPNAVMFFQYSGVASPDVRLTDDDVAAICDAYPPSRPVPAVCDFDPPKGYATDCGGDVQAACSVDPTQSTDRRSWKWGALALAGAAVVLRWRARRRRSRR